MDVRKPPLSQEETRLFGVRPVQLAKIFIFVLAALVALHIALPWIVFIPTAQIVDTPAIAGLAFDDVTLTTPDGVVLRSWWVPSPNARATLLFFHGNSGNISHRIDCIRTFHDMGLSVFILGYRGYGQSGGRPSISGTAIDARVAWQWLTEEKEIPAQDIVVFGRSLGAAIAVELLRSVRPGALILETAFSSLADMGMAILIPAPVARIVTQNAWNSVEGASEITVPSLSIHSPDDPFVPYRQGRRVYEALAGEKEFLSVHGRYNSGFWRTRDIYFAALEAFITRHFGPLQIEETNAGDYL